jgi:hypothetical protein
VSPVASSRELEAAQRGERGPRAQEFVLGLRVDPARQYAALTL